MQNFPSLRSLVDEGQRTAMMPAISPARSKKSLVDKIRTAIGIGGLLSLAVASDGSLPAQAASKEKQATYQEASNTIAASYNKPSDSSSSPTSITQETHQKISKSVPAALQPLKKTSSINQPLLLNIEAPKEPLDEVAHFTLPKPPRMNFIDMGNTPYLNPKAQFVKPPEINSDKQNNADHNKTSHDKNKHKPILELATGPTFDTNGTHTLAGWAAEVGFPGVEAIPDVRIGGVLFGKGLGGIDQKGVQAYAVEAGPIVSYHLIETSALGRHIGISAFVSGTLGYEHSIHKDEAAHSFMGAGGVGINVEDQESHNFASVETGVGCIVRSTNPEEERKCVNSTTVLVGHAF